MRVQGSLPLGSRRGQNMLGLALIAFFLILEVLSVQRVSLTADEPQHYRYGMNILNLDSTRFDDSKMPFSALNALPKKVASWLPPGRARDFLSDFFMARFMTMMFSALSACVVFLWGRELYGDVAGLVALVLYVFDPNLIAHSQLVTTDVYAAGTLLLACYGIWKFANTRRWRDGIGGAFALGLSQIAKYTSIALVPLLLLALVLHDLPALLVAYRQRGLAIAARYIGRWLSYILLGGAIVALVINIGFVWNRPFLPLRQYAFRTPLFKNLQNMEIMRDLPVPFPYPFLEGLDRVMFNEQNGKSFGNIYLLGQIRSGRGFAGYYFVASALKVPIATQLIILLALITCFVDRQRRQRLLQNEVFLLLPVTFYSLYFNFFYNAQIGFRFYIVIFPLLYVLAGGLFANWAGFSAKQKWTGMALMAYLMISVLSYYPHYLAYFNELVWDRKYAYKYLADSNLDWGQGRYYLEEYLSAHPEAVYAPAGVMSGQLVVSASDLVGATTWENPDQYKWLRDNFQPTRAIAYQYLVFDISPQDLQRLCSQTSYCR